MNHFPAFLLATPFIYHLPHSPATKHGHSGPRRQAVEALFWLFSIMPKKNSSTPAAPPSLKTSTSSGAQKTLFGFFQKTPSTGSPVALPARLPDTTPVPSKSRSKSARTTTWSSLTPVPSSDTIDPEHEDSNHDTKASLPPSKSLPSPVSADEGQTNGLDELTARGTPSRRVRYFLLLTETRY